MPARAGAESSGYGVSSDRVVIPVLPPPNRVTMGTWPNLSGPLFSSLVWWENHMSPSEAQWVI